MERAEEDGERPRKRAQGSRGLEGHPPLQPFRQLAILSEVERESQERAWRRIRGEAARLKERDREMAVRKSRVREKKEAAFCWAHRVIPDPEGDTPP